MYTILKNFRSREVQLAEIPSFIISFIVAELFYKLHSFTLETICFLATWFVLSMVGAFVLDWFKQPELEQA